MIPELTEQNPPKPRGLPSNMVKENDNSCRDELFHQACGGERAGDDGADIDAAAARFG